MCLPVTVAQLVADQRVTCCGVGNAQQRFGETHQRNTLGAIQGKLLHERVDAARGRAHFTHVCGESGSSHARLLALRARLLRQLRKQVMDDS